MSEEFYKNIGIVIKMPSQVIHIIASVYKLHQRAGATYDEKELKIIITYFTPTMEKAEKPEIEKTIERYPRAMSFSEKHFDKELEAYIVQEAMADLTDKKHLTEWAID